MRTSLQKKFIVASILLALFTAGARADTIYVSDDSKVIEQFDTNGVGSVFGSTGNGPQGEAFDTAGNLYVANYTDGTILKFATNGASSTFTSGLNGPWVLAFDGAGFLYVGNFDDNTIWKFDTNGTGSVYINSGLNAVDGLAFDAAGALYVANYNSGKILKFVTPDNGVDFATNVTAASGMAFDASGDLYVADYDENQIWKIDTNGVPVVFTTTNLSHPNDVAFDNAGNLYVANAGNATVTKFTPDGSSNVVLTASGMAGAEFVAAWPIPAQLIPPNISGSTPLLSAVFTNNQFQITVTGTTNANYIVQAATNLSAPDWIPLSTNAAPFVYVESNVDLVPDRFYRAVAQ